ncbi:hypothetical protein [Pseudonocardia sp. H11422]|uniref:hypothetical protein n=1 Tax=Pseudonocardia sp. H11422 TaxID=2835866 RepID=UPI001BDBB85C|nr:hypothetical protein [Pseudonocardia sp. H11422]
MIRAGRKALDRIEVGAVHGLSATQAPRRRPWAQPGHPAPVNRPGGRKGGLWDAEQVRAYVAGEPVPSLPEHDDPADLLDAAEAAELSGIEPVTWVRYVERGGLVPDADELVCEQPHWRRDTVLTWLANRPGRGAGGGRRPNNGMTDEQMQQRAAELLAEAASEGRAVSARELARVLGVSPTKAGKVLAVAQAAT